MAGLATVEHMTPPPSIPAPVDPSTIPALSRGVRPVGEDRDAEGLTVEGELPQGLSGAFLRNGPNPLFPPLGSYTYPLDGDGMIDKWTKQPPRQLPRVLSTVRCS